MLLIEDLLDVPGDQMIFETGISDVVIAGIVITVTVVMVV